MRGEVLTTFDAETPEAKARWFQSLTMEERARIFSEWHDFALALNPHIAEEKNLDFPHARGPVCILTQAMKWCGSVQQHGARSGFRARG